MKVKITFLILVLILALFAGCGKKAGNTNDGTGTNNVTSGANNATSGANNATGGATNVTGTGNESGNTNGNATPDVVTTASIVNTEEAFLNAISAKGTWIIAITQDMTINKDLLIEGDFKNGKKDDAGKDITQRKLALYSQDENRTITARYTLTAPKLTVTSPEASIQHGTFKGDLYVSVVNFKLIDATVDGNVYFTSKEAQDTFNMDATSKITGKQELKQ